MIEINYKDINGEWNNQYFPILSQDIKEGAILIDKEGNPNLITSVIDKKGNTATVEVMKLL